LTDRADYISSLGAINRMRSDFNGDNAVTGADVGEMLTIRAAAIANIPPGFVSCVGGVCP
jgi:hypothetical protein